MSEPKKPVKKVVTTTRKEEPGKKTVKTGQSQKRLKPTTSRTRTTKSKIDQPMMFGRKQYTIMGIGIALVFLGMLLMIGGKMPSPDVWDDSIIYGFRRTVLAPILILAGLAVEVYAIFKRG